MNLLRKEESFGTSPEVLFGSQEQDIENQNHDEGNNKVIHVNINVVWKLIQFFNRDSENRNLSNILFRRVLLVYDRIFGFGFGSAES